VEFDPAERAGGMLVDVCHSGKSLHQFGLADCQREVKLRWRRTPASGDEKLCPAIAVKATS
jgi:hypothetical protein